MSDQAAALPANSPLTQNLSGLRDARVGLAIGLIALGLLFHVEIVTAVNTWIESTAYNHCFLIIPIAGFLIWDRRASLRGLTAAPLPWMALLVLPLGVGWLASERLGIMEGRQLTAVSMVEVLFLATLGWRLWLALLGPLLYLYFLVPFGDFLTPRLQDVTTWFIRQGVVVLGISAYIDGYIIDIPEGSFFVATACAGLRFLIASIAFGALYSLLMYRSPTRRILFLAASVILPIIANGFRALGIVWLGHILGSAEAGAADHVLYGWIFFSIVILILIALGLPFRQDEEPAPATSAPMTPDAGAARLGLFAGLAVTALAILGPAVVLDLNQASAMSDLALRPLNLTPDCANQGAPSVPAAATGQAMAQLVNCGGMTMKVEIEVFSPRSTAAPVNAERRHLTHYPGAEDTSEAPMETREGNRVPGWRFVRASDPPFFSAAGLWIGGEPTMPGMGMRLRMARTSVTGETYAPALVVITPIEDWTKFDLRRRPGIENKIAALIESHPGLGDEVRALAKTAR